MTEPSNREYPGALTLSTRKLHESRTVLVFGEVTTALAESVCAQLLALDAQSTRPITVVVHSQGGHVEAGDTIHDVIRFVGAEVWMLASGWVASAGALIYVGVPRERRLALPNTRFLLHQPLGGVGGPASDVEIEARQVSLMRERLTRIFADATGQSYERVLRDTDRNHWMTADEAIDYGLVQRVVRAANEVEHMARSR